MKWLVIVIVCGGLAFLYINNKEDISRIFGKLTGKGSTEKVATDGDGSDAKKEKKPPKKETKPPKEEEKKPKVAERKEKGPKVTPAIAKEFPLPEFKTLDELVGSWQKVPGSAFPRTVTLKKAVEIVIAGGAGKSTMPAGAKAVATRLDDGLLTVGRTKSATITGKTPIDDTDFKKVLGEIYDNWKTRKLRQVYAQRANAMRKHEARMRMANNVSYSEKEYIPLIGERPEQLGSGQVPLMVASINRRDVTEIDVEKIERWGPVRFEMVEGEPYWTGTVNYQTATLFGLIDTEAQALIRKGRVIDWVYTGSGEEVP